MKVFQILQREKLSGTVFLIFLLASLLVFTLFTLHADLGCKEISCPGDISCGGGGSNINCEIECDNGAEIECIDVE